MECNKEEAVRALTIAENKMEGKDFLAAKKIALRAQRLYPGIENILQMLTVCEVHCAAAAQVNGTVDWYGILQVDVTADESVIKKQYRKFALLLHPDKNKFPGAEAAFKLIGEANLTLTDKGKRSIYDTKRNTFRVVTSIRQAQAHYPNQNSYFGMHPGNSNNFGSHTGKHHPHNQAEAQATDSQTFWTACPFCLMRYQYYLIMLNKNIRCRKCFRNFTAINLSIQGSFTGVNQNSNQQGDVGFTKARSQGNPSMKPTVSEPATNVGTEFGGGSKNKVKENIGMDNNPSNEHKDNFDVVNLKAAKKDNIPEFHGIPKAKRRRKKAVQSTDTESSDNEDIEEYNRHHKNVDPSVDQNLRRSTRQKQKITYNENQSDDEDEISYSEFASSLKRPKMDQSTCQSDHTNSVHLGSDEVGYHNGDSRDREREVERGNKSEFGTSSKVDINPSKSVDPSDYADTEFYDFEKKKDASLFAKDQIWAVYDGSDGMPRFYAIIKKVYSPGFKVQYTWLEYKPVDRSQIEWSDKNLPVGCGIFGFGKTQSSEDLPMFSHVMSWENGPSKDTYVLHPKRGEIWALHKDWDIEWKSDPENHRSYKYEVVEVLSDYALATGVEVARLVKVKGFVSLFARVKDEENEILQIPPNEMLKFSHKVPSYKMIGAEKEGIPQGSYELDTASLPPNPDIAFPLINFEQINASVEDKAKIHFGPYSEPSVNKNHEEGIHSIDVDVFPNIVGGSFMKDPGSSHCSSGTAAFSEFPDTEFHRFESQKNIDKFQYGQIWALYDEMDGFPSCYAMVAAVEMDPFKVHVSWLELCPVLAEEIECYKRNMHLGCGKYKLLSGKKNRVTYDNIEAFSHQVKAKAAERKNHYYIHPNVSEVWAVYKNRNIKEKPDHDRWGYDLVEVIFSTTSVIKVKFLEKVKGYHAVFKHRRDGDDDGSAPMEIPRTEWTRFSHHVPSFRLTEERGGKLRGCWELDPASVPQAFLCSSGS